ncbi:hypothetical protein RsTz2092_14040 [Deferribacterales bacterium RsTz2092]|nr:hypothetical protein AGMMS49941_06560 [Deferribacterales bacterium]
MTYGYIRVSTAHQNTENGKFEIADSVFFLLNVAGFCRKTMLYFYKIAGANYERNR